MNPQLINEILQELSHAGEDIEKLELRERLAKRLITPATQIEPMEFLFEMFGKPCFPRGELVGITGKAKSGKTYLSSILMSLCFKRVLMSIRRQDEMRLKVMWIDTEQSEESTQDILRNRIMPMINGACDSADCTTESCIQEFPEEMFQVFNLRGELWQDRLPLLEAAAEQFRPDLLLLDGVRDLVNDINDGIMAQDVIERLMKMASQTRCCIICILHQNKNAEDKNLRGFLGTELRNKAFEVYECTKSPDRIFSVHQTDTRKYDICEKLEFIVNEDGIPILKTTTQTPKPQPQPQASNQKLNRNYILKFDEMNRPVMDVDKIFCDAFEGKTIMNHTELMLKAMEMAGIESHVFYQKCLNEAILRRIVYKNYDLNKKVAYVLAAQPNPS